MTTSTSRPEAPETTGSTIRWWAPAYDAASWLMSFGQEPAIRRKTLALARLSPGERVLDVGGGTGTLALAAWKKVQPGGDVQGIDASPEMVALARRKAKKVGAPAEFRVAPVEALPFADGTFDVVLSSFMLHHLPDDVKKKGFCEIRRVLKPGGRFLAVDLTGKHSPVNMVIGLIGHKMPADYADQLRGMISAAGFEAVEQPRTKFGYLAFIRARAGSSREKPEQAAAASREE